MNTYSEVNGVPAAISYELLTTLLRDTMEFTGYVSSDYISFQHVVERAHAAADAAEAARLGLEAGLDLELPSPWSYGALLAEEVRAGRIDEELSTSRALRLLTAKFELGLFEHPYAAETIDLDAVRGEGRELARRDGRAQRDPAEERRHPAAGRRPAPTSPSSARTPTRRRSSTRRTPTRRPARSASSWPRAGSTTWSASTTTSPTATPRARRPPRRRSGPAASTTSSGSPRSSRLSARTVTVEPGTGIMAELDDAAFDRAVDAARDADMVVLAVGGASAWFVGDRTEGEASDSLSIDLPPVQQRLIDAVAALGKPTVAVLVHGRPYVLPPALLDADAIVSASFNGVGGISALARVLAGEVNPSGKLPYTMPRHQGQLPIFHHQRSASGYRSHTPFGTHYIDGPATPQFPFGFGLSYTTFELADLDLTRRGHRARRRGHDLRDRHATPGTAPAPRSSSSTWAPGPPASPAPTSSSAASPGSSSSPASRERVDLHRLRAPARALQRPRRVLRRCRARPRVFVGTNSDDRALSGSFRVTGEPLELRSSERSFFSTVSTTSA